MLDTYIKFAEGSVSEEELEIANYQLQQILKTSLDATHLLKKNIKLSKYKKLKKNLKNDLRFQIND